jgi:hypothetical protein
MMSPVNFALVNRMVAACERASDDVLRAHYRKLHMRRERMVMGVVGEMDSVHGSGIKGRVFDVTTCMVFAVSHVLGERRRVREWALSSRAGRA